MTELMVLDKAAEHEEEFLNQLIETKGENLPATVDKVLRVFEFTDWKAKAFKSLSDKLGRLEDQTEAYHSALRSGQNWGIAALYAQKRMGEITRDMPRKSVNQYTGGIGSPDAESKQSVLQKQGISRYDSSEAERIAAHPEILDRVIESSKERGEIPTKTAVLNRIKVERNKEYAEQRKDKQDEKLAKTIPKIVSDHYEWVKLSKNHLDIVIAGAKHGKFDPAGKNFMLKKHNEIREKLKEIEGLV